MTTTSAKEINPAAGIADLDALLQHKSRLGALVLLSGIDAMSFTRLRELLSETDGNLGAQLKKLEEAGYVGVKKEFLDRKPVTWYALTAKGRRALKAHLEALEQLLKSAKL